MGGVGVWAVTGFWVCLKEEEEEVAMSASAGDEEGGKCSGEDGGEAFSGGDDDGEVAPEDNEGNIILRNNVEVESPARGVAAAAGEDLEGEKAASL